MKKYHIADLLTLSRLLVGVAILVLTFTIQEPKNRLILTLFSVGSLTDALDGEFARKYKYPNDGKRRWWREYNFDYCLYQYEINDIIADLVIGTMTLIYIARWISPFFGGIYLGATFGVGIFVSATTNSELFTHPQEVGTSRIIEEIRVFIILKRRKWYARGIAVVILTLIIAAKFPLIVTALLILTGIIVAILIIKQKENTRLKQDKTPLD